MSSNQISHGTKYSRKRTMKLRDTCPKCERSGLFCFCWICTLPQEINLYIVTNGMAPGTKIYLLILGISARVQKMQFNTSCVDI